jgi:hypothetical protein
MDGIREWFGVGARRKSMKARIIEVGLFTSKLNEVQPSLERCLRETGDLLIGYQTFDDLTLLVVRLIHDTVQCHLDTLTAAFHADLINSFQIISCQLFKVVFRPKDAQTALRAFPLHMGESWFPAVDEENAAYLCLNSPQLSQDQISWLATQTEIALWRQAS